MRNLEQELRKFTKELEKAKAKGEIEGYTLIGALAVSARAKPRATKDIDFLVSADKSFFQEYFPAIIKSKGYKFKIFKSEPQDPISGLLRIYDKENVELVDIIPVFWKWQEEIIKNTEILNIYKNFSIPVARTEDLIILKLKAGGPQDIIDAEELLKSTNKSLDKERLSELAKRAGVNRQLKMILKEG